MHTSIRERKSEGGFTLIELLVVMIIISILMAVALPTFLAQKNTAQKSKATANIKQIVNAIESCATNNSDGSYTGGSPAGSTGSNCTVLGDGTSATPPAGSLKQFERGLVNLPGGTGFLQYGVAPIGTQGYVVATSIQDGDTRIWFAERHLENGSLLKICGGGPSITTATGLAATAGAAVAGSRTCTNGRWG